MIMYTSDHDVLICTLTKGHICQIDTVLYLTETALWYFYTSSVNNIKKSKQDVSMKFHLRLIKWPITLNKTFGLFFNYRKYTDQMFIRNLLSTSKTPFQMIHSPNKCEASGANIYMPGTIMLTNEDPTFNLHPEFLGFIPTYVNTADYQSMHELIINKLAHKLPNDTRLNFDSLHEHI